MRDTLRISYPTLKQQYVLAMPGTVLSSTVCSSTRYSSAPVDQQATTNSTLVMYSRMTADVCTRYEYAILVQEVRTRHDSKYSFVAQICWIVPMESNDRNRTTLEHSICIIESEVTREHVKGFYLAFEAGVTPLPLRHGLACSVAAFRKHDNARLILHTTRNLHRTIAFHHLSPLRVRNRRDRREAPSSWHARRRISPVAAYVPRALHYYARPPFNADPGSRPVRGSWVCPALHH